LVLEKEIECYEKARRWGIMKKYLVLLLISFVSNIIGKDTDMFSCKYGKTIEVSDQFIPGAQVEKVLLYSPLTQGSNQKITRNGILVRYENAKSTVVICHGLMCDKFDAGFLRSMFPQGTYNFMTFDFRGHGECAKGQRCTLGRDEALDVKTAAKFVKNHPLLKDQPVLALAFSMGAVATIEAQANNPNLFKAMILDCPFDSSEKLIKRGLDHMKLSLCGYEFNIPGRELLQKYAFHPHVQSMLKIVLKAIAHMDAHQIDVCICPISAEQSIQKVTIPCLFIHCRNDDKVTIDAIKSVYSGAQGYKKLWITNGRRHFDSYFYNPERYVARVHSFFIKVLNGKYKENKKEKIIEDPSDSVVPLPLPTSNMIPMQAT